MKRNMTTILLFVVLFVGLALLLYPSVSDFYNSFHQSRAVATYNTVSRSPRRITRRIGRRQTLITKNSAHSPPLIA